MKYLLIFLTIKYYKNVLVFALLPLEPNLVINNNNNTLVTNVKPVIQLIQENGYPAEEHFVTTFDDYILRLHRIPHGKNSQKRNHSIPVLLMHGLFSSSADWIITGPEKAFGYILPDAGFDVWMGNFRGNNQSRNHTYLNPDNSSQFWNFSWHEMGVLDLPAMIDYILNATKQKLLYYIGHSQGNTAFYVMCSKKPEYNKKIRAHFSFAPIVYMKHLTNKMLKFLALWDKPVQNLAALIGIEEFLPNHEFFQIATKLLCEPNDVTQPLCSNIIFMICGYNPSEQNATLIPIISERNPAGVSTKQILHYAQEINSGRFAEYSYSKLGNMQRYYSPFPPKYNIKAVTAPIYLFYSDNDWVSNPKDVEKLARELPNLIMKEKVDGGKYNHLDYVYGIHAPEYVYFPTIKIIDGLEG